MKNVARLLLVLLFTLGVGLLQAAETGQLLLNSELKREPFLDAPTLVTLNSGAEVGVLKRQGGWLQIESLDKQTGWVKMSSVKITGSAAAKGDSGLGELWNVARSGRSGNTGVTVATGVRGLGAEELKNAKPDPEAVARLKRYAATRADAESYAAKVPLHAQQLDYLSQPGWLDKVSP